MRVACGGQSLQLANHEVDDIIGVPLGMNAVDVPGPLHSTMIESEQMFLS